MVYSSRGHTCSAIPALPILHLVTAYIVLLNTLGAVEPAYGESTTLEADRLQLEGDTAHALGDVHAIRGGRELFADEASYHRPSERLKLLGNVRIETSNFSAEASAASLDLGEETGWMEEPLLHLKESDAWLRGQRMERYTPDKYRLTAVCYTACKLENPAWALRSSRVYVNQSSHRVHYLNARFEVFGLPILYTPYFTHSTDSKRHTGFLSPAFESSNSRGTDIDIPFYWSIAPQLDATLGLRHMTRRGTMPQLEIRHLGEKIHTEVYGELLPNDGVTGDTRYFLKADQEGTLPGGIAYNLDAQRVSDATYLSRFNPKFGAQSARQLISNLSLDKARGPYRLTANFTLLQNLQDFNDPETLQELPRVEFQGNQPLPFGGGRAQLDLNNEYVYFHRQKGTRTHRIFLNPTFDYRLSSRLGYLKPRLGLHWSGYRIDRPDGEGFNTRTLPHFSLEAGTEISRTFQGKDWSLRHVIEPQLFYLYVPFEDQSDLPVLDTRRPPLRLGDLFDWNRFAGSDRIGDANQLALRLNTWLQANSGEARWKAASLQIGQIRFFRDRRVTLPESPSRRRRFSDIFAEFALRPLPNLALSGALQYGPERPFALDEFDLFESQLTWTSEAGYRLKGSFRRRTSSLDGQRIDLSEEVGIQFRAPVTSQFTLFGSFRRSLLFAQNLEERLGVAYNDHCCWGFRLSFADRLLRQGGAGQRSRDTSIGLTFQLRTLGKVGL